MLKNNRQSGPLRHAHITSKPIGQRAAYPPPLLALFASVILLGFGGCSTEIDLNAPEKDIWVVYGILNQDSSLQDIRVMRAFLPTSDAQEYARNNDLSVKGLNLTLRGGGRTLSATQVDDVPTRPEDGVFYPYTTVYRFATTGADALKPGERYDLEIKKPDEPGFQLQSYTYVPQEVRFITPLIIFGAGQESCLIQAALEREYKVEFQRRTNATAAGVGLAFELRAFLDYREQGANKQAVFGPTALFSTAQRCNSSSTFLCYQFRERDIINTFLNQMKPGPLSAFSYGVTSATECNPNPNNLPNAFRFEVTAVDTFLATYLTVNNPAFQDFNTVRPEYSNIRGSVTAYGLFGAINTTSAPAKLSPCSEYLLYLNNRTQPSANCIR